MIQPKISKKNSFFIMAATSSQECEMCNERNHQSIDCHWIYTRCKLVPCNGIRKLIKVKDGANSGKKIFSCSNPMCSYFKWFDDAIKSTAPRYKGGCDAYVGDHKFADCPWSQTPCIHKFLSSLPILFQYP